MTEKTRNVVGISVAVALAYVAEKGLICGFKSFRNWLQRKPSETTEPTETTEA